MYADEDNVLFTHLTADSIDAVGSRAERNVCFLGYDAPGIDAFGFKNLLYTGRDFARPFVFAQTLVRAALAGSVAPVAIVDKYNHSLFFFRIKF